LAFDSALARNDFVDFPNPESELRRRFVLSELDRVGVTVEEASDVVELESHKVAVAVVVEFGTEADALLEVATHSLKRWNVGRSVIGPGSNSKSSFSFLIRRFRSCARRPS
jgi:hypothetical protein